MFYKRLVSFLLFLFFIPLFLSAERPYFGIEGEVFFPKGNWAEKLDYNFFYKFTMQRNITHFIGAGLSIGSTSFVRKYEREVKLLMFPVIYADIIAEKRVKKSPLHLGIFLGPNFSVEKITYGEGIEKAIIWGWGMGGMLELRFKFIIKPYLKARYVLREDSSGLEFALGINI